MFLNNENHESPIKTYNIRKRDERGRAGVGKKLPGCLDEDKLRLRVIGKSIGSYVQFP